MFEPIRTASETFQKMGKGNCDAALRSYGELNDGFKAIAAELADYSKAALVDATRTLEQLAGAQSFQHAIEIQLDYASRAYNAWVAEASKLSDIYALLARDAYKPVEHALTRTA
jgi:hypothetical protein